MIQKCLNSLALQRKRAPFEKRSLQIHSNLIDFASNDYLGLARSKELLDAIVTRIAKLDQIGSTGSRLLTGTHALTYEVEERIAAYHGGESALLFPSGYQANLGLFSTFSRDETIAYHRTVHASIRDGIRLSCMRAHAFETLEQLEALLRKGAQYVAVESIDSSSGAFSPLDEISTLCSKYNANLIVDEAHATGTFGPGLLKHPYFARIHTFSKALGVSGGAVVSSLALRDHLINFSRPFIYSTALSHLHLIAIDAAYSFLPLPYPFERPILSIPIGSAQKARFLAADAKKNGILISALTYPTVARGDECLRITFHTTNTQEEIEKLHAWLHHHGY